MKILIHPNPILRKKSEPYTGNFDNELRKFVKEMFELMKKDKGIGLAAPQLSRSERIITIKIDNKKYTLINPEIIRKSKEQVETNEGCLSVPKTWGKVIRAAKVKVRAKNQFGKKISVKAERLLSVVIQHEIDHLNGILFIDRADPETIRHEEPKTAQKI